MISCQEVMRQQYTYHQEIGLWIRRILLCRENARPLQLRRQRYPQMRIVEYAQVLRFSGIVKANLSWFDVQIRLP
jgi:hypothetical protein